MTNSILKEYNKNKEKYALSKEDRDILYLSHASICKELERNWMNRLLNWGSAYGHIR